MQHYSYLMTLKEMTAYKHLAAVMKATLGRSDIAAQEEARTSEAFSKWLTDDPEVMAMVKDGYGAFVERTSARILSERKEDILLNYCPRCNELARTPKAQQCRFCGCDWHSKQTPA